MRNTGPCLKDTTRQNAAGCILLHRRSAYPSLSRESLSTLPHPSLCASPQRRLVERSARLRLAQAASAPGAAASCTLPFSADELGALHDRLAKLAAGGLSPSAAEALLLELARRPPPAVPMLRASRVGVALRRCERHNHAQARAAETTRDDESTLDYPRHGVRAGGGDRQPRARLVAVGGGGGGPTQPARGCAGSGV